MPVEGSGTIFQPMSDNKASSLDDGSRLTTPLPILYCIKALGSLLVSMWIMLEPPAHVSGL